MRPLLCALAGLALLRAAGAFAEKLGQRVPDLQPPPSSLLSPAHGCSTHSPRPACTPGPEQEPGQRKQPSIKAAEPFSPSRGDPAWSSRCDRHMVVQGRLEVMEETVEKTVEHLEAEVKGLLGLLEELAWNLPLGPFGLAPDLLGDDPS